MTPPYMVSGENSPEMLIANMNYAGVNGAVIVGEVMDGNQNGYFRQAKAKYPDRLKICAFFDEGDPWTLEGFDGIKICACKLKTPGLQKHFDVFAEAGYTLANRGQLITWPSWHNPKRECPIDNILVKGFEMSDVQVRGHDKLSDHKMISCRLKFKE